MRESWRAAAMLVRTAWRADPWRSAGLLLEPISFLRVPLFAWCLKLMADGVFRHEPRLLLQGALGITVTRALWFLGTWTGAWIRNRLIEEVGFALDREIATLAAELPGLEHHERPEYLDRLEMLRQEQGVLGNSLNTLLYTANTVVAGLSTIVGLAIVHPALLLLVPFGLPALPIATQRQRWLRDAEQRAVGAARRARHLQSLTIDRNAGMELRVFGLEREVLSRFDDAWTAARGILVRALGRVAVLEAAGDLIFLAGFAGAVALMLTRAAHGLSTAGEVVMVVYLGQQVMSSVVDPIRRVAGLGEVLRAGGRVLWLRDYAAAQAQARQGTRPVPDRLRDGIVLEHVSFRYPGTEAWVLRDVSVRIPAGAVVALVGENGAGKTTLVKLLSGMYQPTEGRILVDGVPLAELDLTAWRARLSAAFQDFARFELAARHTVGVGHLPRVDDPAAMEAALERAGAADVMAALPDGGDTQLGTRWDGGVDLSTGQWQKLALGRALMRPDPLVVFFDEPTASLDALAEHALFGRYAAASRAGSARGAVTVLVSHRFSTVRSADLILVISGGGVAELGRHHELLLQNGMYAELYRLQARAYQPLAAPVPEPA